MMDNRLKADWVNRLSRAALPGAAQVELVRTHPEPNAVNYRLRSMDSEGELIGDDRDYDLLKAVMSPLETLAEQTSERGRLRVVLDIAARTIEVEGA